MSTMEEIISDNILEAIDTVLQKQLSELDYDKTVEAKITDNSKSSEGFYTVFYGTSFFDAYSKDTTFSIGDTVQILIPNNDSGKTKIILGKIANKDEIYNIEEPFKNFVSVTKNLIETVLNNNKSLTANGSVEEKLLWEYIGNLDLSIYSTIGLQASFQSLIDDAIEGEYGLRLEITFDDNIVSFYLNNFDMSGNCYNYSTFYKQQKIFNLSQLNISKITGMSLYFYQIKDSFKDKNNNIILSKDSFNNTLPPNLFVDKIELFFGFLNNEYTPGEDKIEISVDSDYSMTYNTFKTNAIINLSWIYWNDNNTKILTQEDILQLDNFKIEWYYFKKYSDFLLDLEQHKKNFEFEFAGIKTVEEADLLYNELKEATCSYINDNNWQRLTNFDNQFYCQTTFDPNGSEDYQLRAFVIKNDEKILQSNILTFTNENYSNEIVNKKQYGLILNAEDGSFGNYNCYTSTDILNNENEKIRILKAKFFDSNGEEVNLNENVAGIYPQYNIVWSDPPQNSMLNYCKPNESNLTEFCYQISPIYDISATNNIIKCTVTEILEDGTNKFYEAVFDFNFSQSGNIYGNNTIIIDYEDYINNKNNISYTKNAIQSTDTSVTFVAKMFDSNNKEINLNNYSIEWNLIGYDLLGNKIVTKNLYNLNSNFNRVTITKKDNSAFGISTLLTLNVKIIDNSLKQYSQLSYPIAISKDNIEYNHIRGTSSILYKQGGGTPIFNPEPYQIYKYNSINESIEDVDWEIVGSYNKNANNNLIKLLDNNTLEPLGVYLFNAEEEQYGVSCSINNEIVWLQPIVILRTTFTSPTINNWDGKSVDIDSDAGTVAAVMIAAGKKDANDLFTGVMLGDLDIEDENNSFINTGLYGFKDGIPTFGLKDDGTAFFGSKGKGQILIDGNDSILTSQSYENLNRGLKIDLDDAIIDLKNQNYQVYIDASLNNTLTNFQTPLRIGTSVDPNFSINWNGELFARSGKIGDKNSGIYINGIVEESILKLYLPEERDQNDLDSYEIDHIEPSISFYKCIKLFTEDEIKNKDLNSFELDHIEYNVKFYKCIKIFDENEINLEDINYYTVESITPEVNYYKCIKLFKRDEINDDEFEEYYIYDSNKIYYKDKRLYTREEILEKEEELSEEDFENKYILSSTKIYYKDKKLYVLDELENEDINNYEIIFDEENNIEYYQDKRIYTEDEIDQNRIEDYESFEIQYYKDNTLYSREEISETEFLEDNYEEESVAYYKCLKLFSENEIEENDLENFEFDHSESSVIKYKDTRIYSEHEIDQNHIEDYEIDYIKDEIKYYQDKKLYTLNEIEENDSDYQLDHISNNVTYYRHKIDQNQYETKSVQSEYDLLSFSKLFKVDKKGKLYATDSTLNTLTLIDDNEKIRTTVDTNGLTSYNNNFKKIANFNSSVVFFDSNEKKRVEINTDGLQIYNSQGTLISQFGKDSTITMGNSLSNNIFIDANNFKIRRGENITLANFSSTGMQLYNVNNSMIGSITSSTNATWLMVKNFSKITISVNNNYTISDLNDAINGTEIKLRVNIIEKKTVGRLTRSATGYAGVITFKKGTASTQHGIKYNGNNIFTPVYYTENNQAHAVEKATFIQIKYQFSASATTFKSGNTTTSTNGIVLGSNKNGVNTDAFKANLLGQVYANKYYAGGKPLFYTANSSSGPETDQISGKDYQEIWINITEVDGYRPIGIIGCWVSGSLCSYINIYQYYLRNDYLGIVNCRNLSSSTANVTVTFRILYIAESQMS